MGKSVSSALTCDMCGRTIWPWQGSLLLSRAPLYNVPLHRRCLDMLDFIEDYLGKVGVK